MHKDVHVTAVDCDAAALELARENAKAHALDGDDDSDDALVSIRYADMLDDHSMALLGSFDLVVCNPPYIAADAWQDLDASVRDYESHGALVGSAPELDGLGYYRRLCWLYEQGLISLNGSTLPASPGALGTSDLPCMVMEVGAGQAPTVRANFETARVQQAHGGDHYVTQCDVWHDPAGRQRVVVVWRRGSGGHGGG